MMVMKMAKKKMENRKCLGVTRRVGLFKNAILAGDKFCPRLNTGEKHIANKYREGKMKWTLKRESKSA